MLSGISLPHDSESLSLLKLQSGGYAFKHDWFQEDFRAKIEQSRQE